MTKPDNIRDDRAEGTSDSSGNPSARIFYVDSSYSEYLNRIADEGFIDGLSGETGYLLERVSYLHLKPYLATIKRCETNPPTVKEAHDLLTFDRRVKSILFKYIGIFEAQFRAQYSHWMSVHHGNYCLYEQGLFLRNKEYSDALSIFENEYRRKYHISKQESVRVEIDKAVEVMTLGCLGRFFSNTADTDITKQISSFLIRVKPNFLVGRRPLPLLEISAPISSLFLLDVKYQQRH